MAEKVEIRGGDLDGTLLDNAATEATLLRLVEAFEKKNGPGSGDRIQNAYNEAKKRGTKATTALGESFEKTKKAADTFSSGMMGFVTKGLGVIVSGATFAVRSFTDFLSSSFKNYRDIADTGVTFGNNMVEVSRVALNAGMSMGEFSEMVKKNSMVLTSLGGTASEGARRLAELRDGIINSDIGTRFYGLGLTTQEIEGYMGSYFDQMQRLGSLQRRDNATLTKGVSAYVEELDKVTKLTGIERKKLDEQSRRIALDPVFNALRAALSPEQLAKSNANLAMAAEIGGAEFESAIKEISTGVIQSDLAKELASTGALTREAALAIAQGTADAGPIMQRAAGVMRRSGRYADATLLQGNAQLAQGATFLNRTSRLQDAEFQKAQEEQKKRSALTAAFGKVPAVFDNIRNKIFGTIISSGLFDRVLKIFEGAADGLEKYLDPLVAYFGALFRNMATIAENRGIVEALKYGIRQLFGDIQKFALPEVKKMLNDLFGTEDIGATIRNFFMEGFKSIIKVALEGIGSVISSMIRGPSRAQAATRTTPTGQPATGTRDSNTPDATGTMGADVGIDTGSFQGLMDMMPSWERMREILGYGAAASVGLIALIGGLGVALGLLSVPALKLGAAIGIAAGGLGYAFQGLANLIKESSDGLEKVQKFIEGMANQNSDNIRNIGLALGPLGDSLIKMAAGGILALLGGGGLINLAAILERLNPLNAANLTLLGHGLGPLADNLIKMAGGGILALFGGNGLINLGTALEKVGGLDASSITAVAPALERLHQALSLYVGGRDGGLIASLGGAISRFFSGDGGITKFADAFVKFNNIDGNNIKNVASGLQDIRESIGQEFTDQARAMEGYSNNIQTVTKRVTELTTALSNLNRENRGRFTLQDLAAAAGGGNTGGAAATNTATNALIEEQRKLNTMLAELKPIFEATRDNTKDTADRVSNRRNVTG